MTRRGDLWERVVAGAGSPLPPPRLLVILAHPDDEVLAVGTRLERLSLARLVTVTDRAPEDGADARHHGFSTLEAYREARAAELAAAACGRARALLYEWFPWGMTGSQFCALAAVAEHRLFGEGLASVCELPVETAH